MWNKHPVKKEKLSKQILRIIFADVLIAVIAFFLFLHIANEIVDAYVVTNDMYFTEGQAYSLYLWVMSLCFLGSVILFSILFLTMTGQKLSYLKDIIKGIEALSQERFNHKIPIKENNELTELAETLNRFAESERDLKEKEEALKKEKETLVRSLSHDIRTPLTAIKSYSEYMSAKDDLTVEEAKEFALLIQDKATQIKELTDILLNKDLKSVEFVEDGRLLMAQLTEEWVEMLEDKFECQTDMTECPSFFGEIPVQELRRIFNNLASNIEKYADSSVAIKLKILKDAGRLVIEQENVKTKTIGPVESHKLGIDNIRRIAESYGGSVVITEDERTFKIIINLFSV
ncbi:MAG: HAMP domain-containing histidine kinase [Firmicutes bacterium]|nr:HAMP domain-containing histidine kinase [Bacillota bacterium]